MVAIALAPKAGVISGTCTVEKMKMRLVIAARAAPWVRDSKLLP